MPITKTIQRIDLNRINFLRPIDTTESTETSIDIFINLSEKTKKITVFPSITIKKLKTQLEAKFEIPIADQRITFQTKDLRDKATIKDYNIKQDDTLFLIVRGRGGRLPVIEFYDSKYIKENINYLKRLLTAMYLEGRIKGDVIKKLDIILVRGITLITGCEIYEVASLVKAHRGRKREKEDLRAWELVLTNLTRLQPDLLYTQPIAQPVEMSSWEKKHQQFFEKIINGLSADIDLICNGYYDEFLGQIFGGENIDFVREKYKVAKVNLEKYWKNTSIDLGSEEVEIKREGYVKREKIFLPISFFSLDIRDAEISLLFLLMKLPGAGVISQICYGDALYVRAPEDMKRGNIDHYVEVVRRIMDRSEYMKINRGWFLPEPLSRKQLYCILTAQIFRQAWLNGANLLTDFRCAHSSAVGRKKQDRIQKWAKWLNLPMCPKNTHQPLYAKVTILDILLVEAFVRKIKLYGALVAQSTIECNSVNEYMDFTIKKEGSFFRKEDYDRELIKVLDKESV